MAFRQAPPEGLVKFLDRYYDEVKQITDKLINRNAYNALSDKIFALHKTKGQARSREELEAYDRLYDKELLDDDARALSYDGRRFMYAARMFYAHAVDDVKKSHDARRKLVKHIESNDDRLQANPKMYIYALNNLLISSIQLHNELEFHDTLAKLDALPSKLPNTSLTKDLQARVFESRYIHETDFLIKLARYDEGVVLNEKIETLWEEMEPNLDRAFAVTLCNNMMCLYFGAGQYKKALQWLNRVLDSKDEVREDILCYARIINLILHYELGNQLILPYLLRSTYRFLSKRNSTLRYEQLVLDTMKKLLRVREKEELPDIFSVLRDKLITLADDPFERIITEDLNLIAWLESKVSGRGYAEIAAEKLPR
ncbi:MAG: hypothetical protein KDD36_12130 [Flavobacteriales bacterium]|nr:hypothetical protein [Flavobacteriales bacterium]